MDKSSLIFGSILVSIGVVLFLTCYGFKSYFGRLNMVRKTRLSEKLALFDIHVHGGELMSDRPVGKEFGSKKP